MTVEESQFKMLEQVLRNQVALLMYMEKTAKTGFSGLDYEARDRVDETHQLFSCLRESD